MVLNKQAARAFDRAAISIRGVASAVLNFPITDYEDAEIANLQGMNPEQLVSYLKKESYRTNTATKFHRKRNHAESADENQGTEQACSGDITAQEMVIVSFFQGFQTIFSPIFLASFSIKAAF